MDPFFGGVAILMLGSAVISVVANRRAARLARDDVDRTRRRNAERARLTLLSPGVWKRVEGARTISVRRDDPTPSQHRRVLLTARTPCHAAARTSAELFRYVTTNVDRDGRPLFRDVILGDPTVDLAFIVTGADPAAVHALFSPPVVRFLLRGLLSPRNASISVVGLDDVGDYVVAELLEGTDADTAAIAAQAALDLAIALDEVHAALPPLRIAPEAQVDAASAAGSPFAIR